MIHFFPNQAGKLHLFLIVLLMLFFVASRGQTLTVIPSSKTIEVDGQTFFLHTVEKGHTLYSISRAYGVSIDEIEKRNPGSSDGLSVGAVLQIPSRNKAEADPPGDKGFDPAPSFIYHIVKSGETLYAISKIYGADIAGIEALNPEIKSEGLKAGNRIRIPAHIEGSMASSTNPSYRIHIVQAGETTYGIAKQYQVSVDEISLLNPAIRDGLQAGMQLRIPASKDLAVENGKGEKKHTVKRRESLADIAAKYDLSIQELVNANPELSAILGDPPKGTALLIPLKSNEAADIPAERPVEVADVSNAQDLQEHKKGWRNQGACIADSANRSRIYKVALMLPFFASGVDTIQSDAALAKPPADYPSFRFIQFYQGVLQALDSLEKEGLQLELSVYDVAGDTQQVHRLLKENDFRDMDLFLGPLFSGSFEVMSRYAHQHKIPIVNPMTTRDEVILNRPEVFKAFPSDADRMQSLAGFLLDTYPGAKTFVAGRNGDKEAPLRRQFLKAYAEGLKLRNLPDSSWYDIQGAGVNPGAFSANLSTTEFNIIVALTSDQVLVFNLMRKLYAQQKTHPIIVIGLPSWENFTGLDPEYLQAMHLHIIRNTWVDYADSTVASFVKDFRESYKAEPDAFAFQAYDLTQFFLRGMMYYGREFGNCMHRFEYAGLQTVYRFNRTGGNGFTNAYLNVYRIMDFQQVNARKFPVRLE